MATVTCDLHGRMTVQVAVPSDAQKTLARKRLTRMVRTWEGETVASVTQELEAQIDQAREKSPMRITIDVQASHDQQTKARIEQAIITLMGAMDLDQAGVGIRFEKPRG